MSGRSESRCAEAQWRGPIVRPAIHRIDILKTAFRQQPALARLLRLTVLRTMCRTRAQAEREPCAPAARSLARDAAELEAVAAILEELK